MEDHSSIQITCCLCTEEFSPEDDFQGQFIECSNCHRRWHPHPDAAAQGNTNFCRCGICHMFQSNLSSFDNVTDPEYLAGIGTEFIAERCRTLGKKHDAICMYVKHNVAEIMKHKDYIVDYIRLTETLNKFIDNVNVQKEYVELSKQLASLESALLFQHYKNNKELYELRSQIITLRNRLGELRNKSMSPSIQDYYNVISFGEISSNAKALELIVNGFKYDISIRDVEPRICLSDSDIDTVTANRDILVSLYPSIFEVPREFIETFKHGPYEFKDLTSNLMINHYKQIQDSVTKLDSKFTRVGICSVCEAAPVYIDEHDEYRCSGCQAHICKLCFKENNDKHKCNKIDIDEWNLIQTDTKACPNCGFRFGHHSLCNSMFCTNCYHGFNYENLKEIKGWFENPERTEWTRKIGVTNTHIVAAFRQLSTDIQTEVITNVGRNMPTPFALLVEGINALYKNHGSINVFDSINNELITKTEFGQYKDNAVSIFLCEVMKEIIIDYIIEVLEVCEEMNEGQVNSIEELIKNEVDLKMNRAAEKLAINIKRLYCYFPMQRIKEIDEIETKLIRSIAAYAEEAVGSSITALNNVFNVDDCSGMSQGLQSAYISIERFIGWKKEPKPIILEQLSIKSVFKEYKRRFNIQEDVEFQINLGGSYRDIFRDDVNNETTESLPLYVAAGHVLSLKDVVENRIRSVNGYVYGKPFRYADFKKTDTLEAEDVTLTDDELIRRILIYYLSWFGEEYNDHMLSFIKIYRPKRRFLGHNNDGYFLIGPHNGVSMLSYSDFITYGINYRDSTQISIAGIVESMMRAEQSQ